VTAGVMSDQYIRRIVAKYTPRAFKKQAVLTTYSLIGRILRKWANRYLFDICPSGSYAKGTSLAVGTDLDIYVCVRDIDLSLGDIFDHLYDYLTDTQIPNVKKQNVSLGFYFNGHKCDVTPARKQKGQTNNASIYLSTANTWTQTNVRRHIAYVRGSNRITEIRTMKIWKYLKDIDVSSFYLELIVIEALKRRYLLPSFAQGYLSRNIVSVLEYIRDELEGANIFDPANSGNIITDDMSAVQKKQLSRMANNALNDTWDSFIY